MLVCKLAMSAMTAAGAYRKGTADVLDAIEYQQKLVFTAGESCFSSNKAPVKALDLKSQRGSVSKEKSSRPVREHGQLTNAAIYGTSTTLPLSQHV